MFKAGDKVRVKEGTDWDRIEGLTGVVSLVDEESPFINVTLDYLPLDIEESGTTKENWFMLEDELELVINED